MQVQVHTNHAVRDADGFAGRIEAEVRETLGRFNEQLTRIEVHLSEINGHKPGANDKRCVMEARPAGHQPVAVTHESVSWDEAVARACEKLEASLAKMSGRLGQRKGRTPMSGPELGV